MTAQVVLLALGGGLTVGGMVASLAVSISGSARAFESQIYLWFVIMSGVTLLWASTQQ